VTNAAVKALVTKMHDGGLSPKTISTYIGLVKLVVGSALDDEGEPLFPRKWNADYIDMPVIRSQRQPTFTVEVMNAIVQQATGQDKVLYSLLAGTGLRAGEAFGLEVKHLSRDCRTITIEQSCWQGAIQTPKTANAYRQVDINSELAQLLKSFVGDRQSGLLFQNRSGRPLSQTNVLRRSLHPILAGLGVAPSGFHAMRRFRATWLRKQRAPEDLIKCWLGHSKTSVTDTYVKLAEDVEFRRQVAEQTGTGFVVPAYDDLRPVRPRIAEASELVVAA
jgi:integrase